MNFSFPSLSLAVSGRSMIIYEVMLDLKISDAKNAIEKIESVMLLFVLVGAHGGLSIPSARPIQSRLTLLPNDANLVSKLEGYFVDSRAFQLLRNMCSRLSLQNIAIKNITVLECGLKKDLLSPVPVPSETNESDVYPEISSLIEFEVLWEQSEFSKSKRCLVEFTNPVDSTILSGLNEWIRPWYQLLEEGAFAMPLGSPDETESIRGTVNIFDEYTIEISIVRFQVSECAWNVLINMLEAYCTNSFKICRVIID